MALLLGVGILLAGVWICRQGASEQNVDVFFLGGCFMAVGVGIAFMGGLAVLLRRAFPSLHNEDIEDLED